MARDPWEDPDVKDWVARTQAELPDKLRDSAIVTWATELIESVLAQQVAA